MSCILTLSFALLLTAATVAAPQNARVDSKRILGKWSNSRHGADSIFHRNGSWGIQRDGPEEIHGRWWIRGHYLFLTYPEDNGVGTPVHIETAKYKITFISDDRFTTETQGITEYHERVR
jgi:hypothetical protein